MIEAFWFMISGERNRISLQEAEKAPEGINKEARDKLSQGYIYGDGMIIPVRCFSCGKVVGHLWEQYKERVEKGEDSKKILDELGLKRYCCRGLFLTHVDLIDKISDFQP